MNRMICAPSRYIQGPGELENLAAYAAELGGHSICAIADPFACENYGAAMEAGFIKEGVPFRLHRFGGECCRSGIDQLVEELKAAGCDLILGIGGGKALDTAKAAGYFAELPIMVVPTAASSDAPCSAIAVLNRPDGTFERYLVLRRNPDLVVVDTGVIAGAPVRLLVAGMGDALATYYEARACRASFGRTSAGGSCSNTAMAIARTCRDTLFADGYQAKLAVECHAVTQALENVVEANIYLSGVGFESGGLAAAHAVNNAFSVLPECRAMHGEKVAFGLLTQLVLENAPEKELAEVLRFCKQVGLPTTLAQLGLSDISPEALRRVAEESCADTGDMRNMPFPVCAEDVLSALLVADRLE